MKTSVPFGIKIKTSLYIDKPLNYKFPFFEEYLKEIREIINLGKLILDEYQMQFGYSKLDNSEFIKLKKLVSVKHIKQKKVVYFAFYIPVELGIQAIKLFDEKISLYNDYIRSLKVNGKNFVYKDSSYVDIYDYLPEKIYKSLERNLSRKRKKSNSSSKYNESSKRIIQYSVKKVGNYKGRTIIKFYIDGEDIDLF